MAVLVRNVFDHGSQQWYGPAYGNTSPPPDVAARIDDECWDEPPVKPRTAGELAEVAHHDAAVAALGHELTEAEVVGSQHLDDVPLDREALLAFADAHDLDVNRKLGPVNLKAAIAQALGAR
jgi:hypothetical protein